MAEKYTGKGKKGDHEAGEYHGREPPIPPEPDEYVGPEPPIPEPKVPPKKGKK
jgi:hypothetical protein